MKFFLTTGLLLLIDVMLLYYLMRIDNFLPFDSFGNMNWLNISIFIFLLIIGVFTFLLLALYGGVRVYRRVKKEEFTKKDILTSFKYSVITTIGLFIIFLLNHLGILNIIWGGLILVVVISTFLII